MICKMVLIIISASFVKACFYYPRQDNYKQELEYYPCGNNELCMTLKMLFVSTDQPQYGAIALSDGGLLNGSSEAHYCVLNPGNGATLLMSFPVGNDLGSFFPESSSSLTLLSTEVGFDFFSCTYKRPYSVTSPSGEKRNVSDQSFYLFNFQCQLDENSEPISNEFDSSLEVVNLLGDCPSHQDIQCNQTVTTIRVSKSYARSLIPSEIDALFLADAVGQSLSADSQCSAFEDPSSQAFVFNTVQDACIGETTQNSDGTITYSYFVFVGQETAPGVFPSSTPLFSSTPFFGSSIPVGATPPYLASSIPPFGLLIDREPMNIYTFNCTYLAQSNLTAVIDPLKLEFGASLARDIQINARMKVSANLSFAKNLTSVSISDDIYILVEIDQPSTFVLQLLNCSSTLSADPNDVMRTEIIEEGCPLSPNPATIIEDRAGPTAKFSVPAQKIFMAGLQPGQHFYYFHCEVDICDPAANSTCSEPKECSGRKKRSFQDEGNDHLNRKMVHGGPIAIEAESNRETFRISHPSSVTELKCKNKHGCSHECMRDVRGHVFCTCPTGSVLEENGKSCKYFGNLGHLQQQGKTAGNTSPTEVKIDFPEPNSTLPSFLTTIVLICIVLVCLYLARQYLCRQVHVKAMIKDKRQQV
ncbi:uncharacterized protein LOC143468500 [Clavelina lepadiformis]|uniref:uncharacterized protein LOC143468500 n=1 Tax=Clavelina lepadiformis TaxID=159417 RepID=UPI004041C6CD